MLRIDLVWEEVRNMASVGKFGLTVYVFDFVVQFCLPIALLKTSTASLFTVL